MNPHERFVPAERAPPRLFTMYGDIDEATCEKAWLVEGLLGAGEVSAVYGPPGCGKGVGVQDLALHVAAGLQWHGRPVSRGAAIYIALERRKLVERRALAFRKKHGLPDLPFAVVGGIYDFRAPATATQIADICRQVEELTCETAMLIVVDTVNRALAGGDENSSKDMGALVTSTALLQEYTGAHVLLVHHTPYDSDRLRGHGALLGAVDTTLSVSNVAGVRHFKVVKANDSEEGQSIAFTIEGVQIGRDGTTAPVAVPSNRPALPQSDRGPRLTPNQRTMLAILQEAGTAGLTTEEWTGRSKDTGVGQRRRADLTDARLGLVSKGLVREYADRWHVVQRERN